MLLILFIFFRHCRFSVANTAGYETFGAPLIPSNSPDDESLPEHLSEIENIMCLLMVVAIFFMLVVMLLFSLQEVGSTQV